MQKLLLLLLTAELLAAALGTVPETALTTPVTAPVVSAAPESADELRELVGRIVSEYDPAAAGTVGAIRWAEKLLNAWTKAGEDPEAARRAGSEVDAQALAARLPRLRWAAEKLCSGADLGLMNEPGHKNDWSGTDAQSLFDALCQGAGLEQDGETP